MPHRNHALISIIIPFYNEAAHLPDMLNGLQAQTFTDFEAILINDASTDNGADIVRAYNDERFILVQQEKNKRNATCRNLGFSVSKGEYIAVHDADDIASPTRLEEQVAFLETHPDISVCGTYIYNFSKEGVEEPVLCKTSHAHIMADSLFKIPIIHTTCMLRREIFEDGKFLYDEEQKTGFDCKDYDLFNRLLVSDKKFANTPSFLMKKRVHGSSVTFSSPMSCSFSGNAHARRHLFQALHLEDGEMIRQHNQLCDWLEWPNAVDVKFLADFSAKEWFHRITLANEKARLFDPAALEEVFGETLETIKNRNNP